MPDSMAQARGVAFPLELPAWKNTLCTISAVLLAILFLVSGVWKITDPMRAATLMTQALVPQPLSLPAALGFGIGETFGAVLLLVPRWRRWGAWLVGLLLIAFMGYFAIFYSQLRGEDCNCFPWIERAVGPAFFIGDGIMLAAAVMAGLWARRSESLRQALLVLAAVSVFAGVSFGVNLVRQTGATAPSAIQVDGKSFPLHRGKIFIYFFDPECAHCDAAARRMAKFDWGQTKLLVVPTAQPQFAGQFLTATGLQAGISSDLQKLTKVFPIPSGPSALVLDGGRQVSPLITNFDGDEPAATLKRLGFVH